MMTSHVVNSETTEPVSDVDDTTHRLDRAVDDWRNEECTRIGQLKHGIYELRTLASGGRWFNRRVHLFWAFTYIEHCLNPFMKPHVVRSYERSRALQHFLWRD